MENNQHVRVPNNMTKQKKVTPKDLVVYAAIKSWISGDSKTCNPSLNAIQSRCGASLNTIRKCIDNLEEAGYITVDKHYKASADYTFTKDIHFEQFSIDCLTDKRYSFTERAYLIASQQYMFKDETTKTGRISYSDAELSQILNMSYNTLRRCQDTLEEKGLLTIQKVKDSQTGVVKTEKTYSLEDFNRAVAYKIMEHDEQIQSLKDELKRQELRHKREISELKEELKNLKPQLVL